MFARVLICNNFKIAVCAMRRFNAGRPKSQVAGNFVDISGLFSWIKKNQLYLKADLPGVLGII